MSLNQSSSSVSTKSRKHISYELFAFILLAIFLGAAGIYLFSVSAASLPVNALLVRILLLDSQQVMWFITRSAGIIAYLLLWLSMVWGLAIPSRIFGDRLSGDFTFDFHQFLSLLALGFLGLHIFILTADRFLPFTVVQVLIPFIAPYRPIWIGIGTLGMYLLVLVTVTFYVRRRIGMRAFRYIHTASLLAYLGAVVHGFMAGTDSSLLMVQFMYASTFLVVVFLTVYWLIGLVWNKISSGASSAHPLPDPLARKASPRRSP